MRVLKSAKWVWSVAASSGMVLILSGNALAAEGGPDMTAQTVQQSSSTTTVETTGAQEVVVQVSQNGSTHTEAAPIDAAAAAEPVPVSTEAAVTVAAIADPVEVASPDAATSVEVAGVPASVDTVMPAQVDGGLVGPSNHAAFIQPKQSMVYIPMLPDSIPDVLESQPMVVTPPTSSLPMAPAQPTGVLGHLSTQVAGPVVKSVSMTDVPVPGVLLFTLMIFLTLLNRVKTVKVFAHGSRREGFAHAPRGDVASATLNLIFATPFSMSYVTAIRQDAAHF